MNEDALLGKHVVRNKKLLEMTPKEAVDEGLIPLERLPELIKAKNAYNLQVPAENKNMVRGIWIWGRPGVGKSHCVRMNEDSLYIKA